MRVRLDSACRLGVVFLGAQLTLCAGVIAVVNPSFELGAGGAPLTSSIYLYTTTTQPSGWTVVQGNMEIIQTGYAGDWVAQDGSYSVDMNGENAGNTVLTQTISGLIPGASYVLTFGLAANVEWCPVANPCSLQVSIAGVTKNYSIGQGTMVFTDQSFVFTPSASSATLSFTDTTNRGGFGGPAIDNIRITNVPAAVPSLSAWGLVLLGFVLAGSAGLLLRTYHHRRA